MNELVEWSCWVGILKTRISPLCLIQVAEAFEVYRKEAEQCGYTYQTPWFYLHHVKALPRRLNCEFTPGENLRRRYQP